MRRQERFKHKSVFWHCLKMMGFRVRIKSMTEHISETSVRQKDQNVRAKLPVREGQTLAQSSRSCSVVSRSWPLSSCSQTFNKHRRTSSREIAANEQVKIRVLEEPAKSLSIVRCSAKSLLASRSQTGNRLFCGIVYGGEHGLFGQIFCKNISFFEAFVHEKCVPRGVFSYRRLLLFRNTKICYFQGTFADGF